MVNYCSTGSVSDVRNFQSKLVGLLNTTTSVLSHYHHHHHHYNILITFFLSSLLGWLMTDIHLQTIEY